MQSPVWLGPDRGPHPVLPVTPHPPLRDSLGSPLNQDMRKQLLNAQLVTTHDTHIKSYAVQNQQSSHGVKAAVCETGSGALF
jgi:hypothetical protein